MVQACCRGYTYLGCVSRTGGLVDIVNLLVVNEREEGVVALHLPIWSLETCSGLKLVPRCEPIPTSSLANDLATASSRPVTAPWSLLV